MSSILNAIYLTINIFLLDIILPCEARKDVSVTSQGWVLPPEYLCHVFTMGVNRFLLEGATLLNDGSIFDGDLRNNITAANEITDCAEKSGVRSSVALYTDDYPFAECTPEDFNFTRFENQAQALVTTYGVEEVTFWIWAGNFQVCSWQMARKISNVIRPLRTKSGRPVGASLGFAAEPMDSPLWDYIKKADIGNYFDTISVHFGSPGLFDDRIINISFAKEVVNHLITLGISRSQVQLQIEASGFLQSTLMPKAYDELIRSEAPHYGDGYFEGFVYHSQKQVDEKMRLIKDERLKGFSLKDIIFDLVANDTRSLLNAALYHSQV